MPRLKKPNFRTLRGSVMQNTPPVRLRAESMTRGTFLARLGALAGSATLILAILIWLWVIGWPQRQMQRLADGMMDLTRAMHFAVTDVQVDGRQQTSKEALTTALGVKPGDPIFSFDPTAAEARLAKLPWVASATVERCLPDIIYVHLAERVPLARWQHDGHTIVVDTEGHELPDAPPDKFTGLPLVVGAGAATEAADLLEALRDAPEVANRMTAATWVGLRRWDIYLPGKIVAKMPEGKLPEGLRRLSDLITEQKILERDIVSIDLRFPDRVIMEQSGPVNAHPSGEGRL